MYARSNTITTEPSRIDDGIAFVRDQVMPAVQQMDGCVGVSMLVDRGSGRCIVTTAWRDQEVMTASAERVRDVRQRAAEVFGGQPEVAEWEVAVMHRVREAPDGACTRVIWGRGDPEATDRMIDTMRMALVPKVEEIPGFCSISHLVDRRNGSAVSAVTYQDRAAMEAARERGASLRQEFSQATGGEITGVAEFDLVLAHLRVPETV